MAAVASMLFVFAIPFFGSLAVVATTERVFAMGSLMTAVGLVEDEDPGAATARFQPQDQIGDGGENRPILAPVSVREESDDGSAMSGSRADGAGRLGGRHASVMVDERRSEANEHVHGDGGERGSAKKPLESGQGVG